MCVKNVIQDRKSTYSVILRHIRLTIVAVKAIKITYSECVSVALVVRDSRRMRLIILLSVACLVVPYFST
jgi:hypothetical protein